MTQESTGRRGFPVARLGGRARAHYVDEYRYDWPRTLCGREVRLQDVWPAGALTDAPLCGACERCTDHPTYAELRAYQTCTDCGISTLDLGEFLFQIRPKTWELAYPGYNRHHIGVGTSRPCIGCLEQRLGRTLHAGDFTAGHQPEDHLSDRLNDRITATESFPVDQIRDAIKSEPILHP